MKTDEVARKIEPQPASTLEAAEIEGLRAALGGCAGTHNPHVFGDPVLREAWARGMRQVHAYRDRELEIQVGRLPLLELCTLLRAVFLGAEGQDINREAGRLFDALASLPLLPVPAASGGAGEVSKDDTPERLPDLIGQFGDHYADVDLEAGETELPVMLTLYHAALLEAHAGGDEADAALPLGFDDAEALGVRLIEQARRGRASLS